MSVLLQNRGPAGVQLHQDGLTGWQPGFDQSYGLPDGAQTPTDGESVGFIYICSCTAEPGCKDEEEPVEFVGAQQLHGLVQLVDGEQVGRCLQVLLLQTQLLDKRLHRLSPRLETGWRKEKIGELYCCLVRTTEDCCRCVKIMRKKAHEHP